MWEMHGNDGSHCLTGQKTFSFLNVLCPGKIWTSNIRSWVGLDKSFLLKMLDRTGVLISFFSSHKAGISKIQLTVWPPLQGRHFMHFESQICPACGSALSWQEQVLRELDLACDGENGASSGRSIGSIWLMGLATQHSSDQQTSPIPLIWSMSPNKLDTYPTEDLFSSG